MDIADHEARACGNELRFCVQFARATPGRRFFPLATRSGRLRSSQPAAATNHTSAQQNSARSVKGIFLALHASRSRIGADQGRFHAVAERSRCAAPQTFEQGAHVPSLGANLAQPLTSWPTLSLIHI